MKKRTIIAIILLILLTTITSQNEINFSKFNLKKIIIKNNSLIKEKEIKKSLISIYNKNLIFLDNKEIEQKLMKNGYIESFYIKRNILIL